MQPQVIMERNWVTSLKLSVPQYASDLMHNIESAMTEHTLHEVEAHSCALAAALAMGAGELAFEITMSTVLFGNDIREEVAQNVVALTVDVVDTEFYVSCDDWINESADIKATPHALAASLVLRNTHRSTKLAESLEENGYTKQQLRDIARIASVIPALGKCLI